jgi:hypothetical protein
MRIRHLTNKMAGAILGFTLLLVIGAASSTTGYAQYRTNDQDRRSQNDGYGNYGGSYDLRQTALTTGYDEGVKEGSNQYSRRSNYRDSNIYQRATQGYTFRLGDRELYRRYFREAFEKGYNSNSNGQTNLGRDDRYSNRDRRSDRSRRGRDWDGYGNYGGSAQLRQTALNAGYNEGNKQGRNDRNKSFNSDYRSQNAYQKATKDYSSKLGDREIYRRYFRAGYENGFSDGMNGF